MESKSELDDNSIKSWHSYLAGAISGSCGVIVGHPFDTMKVQLQVQQAATKYSSLKECFYTIRQQNLSKGFFRGMSWPMMSAGLINSVFFGVYSFTLNVLEGGKSSNHNAPPYMKIMLAGALGGFVQLIPAVPADVIKVVLQSQIPHGEMHNTVSRGKFYSGPLDGVKDIVKLRGLLGLYRGFGTQCLRDVPASAAYFMIYECLSHEGTTRLPQVPSTVTAFVSGGLAGVLSWGLIMPFDMVKSRVQADTESKYFKGFWDCAIKCFNEEGIRIFFRGFTMVALRAFPVNAVTLMTYHECLKLFGHKTTYT